MINAIMSTPQGKAYPVYLPMWDYFQQALYKESKKLAEDIANTLGVPSKPLKDALMKKKKPAAYLVELCDPTEDRFLCEAITQTTAVAQRCRRPVIYGERYCPCHSTWSMTDTLKSKPTLRRLAGDDKDSYYFVDTLTQQIYDVNYNRIGYLEENKAIIFDIEEESV